MIATGIKWLMIFALISQSQFVRASESSGYAGAKGNRFALVIGNSAYKSGPLKNPVNDARAVANEITPPVWVFPGERELQFICLRFIESITRINRCYI